MNWYISSSRAQQAFHVPRLKTTDWHKKVRAMPLTQKIPKKTVMGNREESDTKNLTKKLCSFTIIMHEGNLLLVWRQDIGERNLSTQTTKLKNYRLVDDLASRLTLLSSSSLFYLNLLTVHHYCIIIIIILFLCSAQVFARSTRLSY